MCKAAQMGNLFWGKFHNCYFTTDENNKPLQDWRAMRMQGKKASQNRNVWGYKDFKMIFYVAVLSADGLLRFVE